MSEQTPILKPSAEDVPREVLDLTDAVHTLPPEHRTRLSRFSAGWSTATGGGAYLVVGSRRSEPTSTGHEVLAFDLEATRRERDEYRRKLEETA